MWRWPLWENAYEFCLLVLFFSFLVSDFKIPVRHVRSYQIVQKKPNATRIVHFLMKSRTD